MAIATVPAEKMLATLKGLEQAATNHELWLELLRGTLTLRVPPDEADFAEDAHRKCRFGQWYYSTSNAAFRDHPGFAAIGIEHERIHKVAACMLRSSIDGAPISAKDDRDFAEAQKRIGREIAGLQDELKYTLYNLDPLTGLPNRVGMLAELRGQLGLAKRNLSTCVVALMVLDDFKTVVGDFGRVVGDNVLIKISRHMATHLRSYDKIFRYGDEEFLICLPDTDLPTSRGIVERLREELAWLPHESNGTEAFHVTASFGLALLDPDIPVERSIDRAESALNAAKAIGRDRTVPWDPSLTARPTELERSS